MRGGLIPFAPQYAPKFTYLVVDLHDLDKQQWHQYQGLTALGQVVVVTLRHHRDPGFPDVLQDRLSVQMREVASRPDGKQWVSRLLETLGDAVMRQFPGCRPSLPGLAVMQRRPI